jgi:hypothetical protein
MESSLDIHLDYRFPFAGTRDMSVVFDAFNLFNRQGVLRYDDRTETSFEVLNSDFGRVLEYQNPLQMRFGVRFRF